MVFATTSLFSHFVDLLTLCIISNMSAPFGTCRDGILTVLQSSSTCWAIAVNDYGAIVSTLLALATFASLFFLAYVLHKTLATRTPANIRRQHDKQKRKKQRKHGHRGKGGGKVRANQPQQHTSVKSADADDQHRLLEDRSETLPPLVEDEPVVPPPAYSSSASRGSSDVSAARAPAEGDKSQLSPPPRNRATSSSTVDSNASSVDSGRSTPTPVAANESRQLPTAAAIAAPEKRSTEANKTTGKVAGEQQHGRATSDASRRLPNTRRGKKSDGPGPSSRGAATTGPTTPSRRWDALKPAARTAVSGSGSRQRNTNTSNKQSWNRDRDMHSPPRPHDTKEPTTRNREVPFSASHGSHSQQQHQLPMHHQSPHFPADQNHGNQSTSLSPAVAPNASDLYGDSMFSNSSSATPHSLPPSANTGMLASFGGTSVPGSSETFFSSLNPESPSWDDCRATKAGSVGPPIRPPPGLESLHPSVPFGCGSSDGGSSAPASPYQTTLPSVLDVVAAPDSGSSASSSPFLPPTRETSSFLSGSPRFDDDVRTTLPFGPPPRTATSPHHHHHHVKDNPFATSSDDDEYDEKIEADLQELGGQMVGSILDF